MRRHGEWIAAGGLSAVVAALHGLRLLDAGGLWRDEAAAARLATLSTFAEVRGLFQHEAFPLLFPATLRGYSFLFGAGDRALRVFGLLVGFSIVGLLWRNAWITARTVPLLSLALLGLDLPFLVYGDSVRGYGLGSALVLLTYGLLARTLEDPRRARGFAVARWSLLLVAAVASVRVLLSNAALLFALCAAAAGVAGRLRRRRLAMGILGCGAVAALSLLPYARPLAAARRQWSFIVVYPLNLGRLWRGLGSTLGPPPVRAVWLVLVAAGLWSFFRGSRLRPSAPMAPIPLFAVLTIPCALVANGVFLAVLGYPPRPWYFLPLLALLASALDTVFGSLAPPGGGRLGFLRAAAVALVAGAQAVPLAAGTPLRQTNVDRVARRVARSAAAEDLVVVDPWYYGVSFNRYYKGAARWVTLPDLPDHRIHRYDLLKQRLATEHPIDGVLAAVAATLSSRHRVWWIGGEGWLRPGEVVPVLPPAPRSPAGWHDWPYTIAWSRQLAAFLASHAQHAADLADPGLPAGEGTNGLEDLSLVVAEGWRRSSR